MSKVNNIGVINEDTIVNLTPRQKNIWDKLSERDQDLYNMVASGATRKVVATCFRITELRVSQIYDRIIDRMSYDKENWVFDLNLSVRAYNILTKAKINSIEDVYEKIVSGEIYRYRGVGPSVVKELKGSLNNLGYEFDNEMDFEIKDIYEISGIQDIDRIELLFRLNVVVKTHTGNQNYPYYAELNKEAKGFILFSSVQTPFGLTKAVKEELEKVYRKDNI